MALSQVEREHLHIVTLTILIHAAFLIDRSLLVFFPGLSRLVPLPRFVVIVTPLLFCRDWPTREPPPTTGGWCVVSNCWRPKSTLKSKGFKGVPLLTFLPMKSLRSHCNSNLNAAFQLWAVASMFVNLLFVLALSAAGMQNDETPPTAEAMAKSHAEWRRERFAHESREAVTDEVADLVGDNDATAPQVPAGPSQALKGTSPTSTSPCEIM